MNIVVGIFFKVIIPLFSIGVIIFIHELGHFFVAKKRGIIVERFSIGFGPKLMTFKKKGTEYTVSLILFGGFVKFLGDDLTNKQEEVRRIPGSFYAASPQTRIYACLAGPIMNIILGFLIYCIIFLIGKPILVQESWTKVGNVIADSPAFQGGLIPGDEIVKINDKRVTMWKDLQYTIALSGDDRMELEVKRNNKMKTIEVVPQLNKDKGIRVIGILPQEIIKVKRVLEGGPAQKAGLLSGDIIFKVDDISVFLWSDLEKNISFSETPSHTITVIRDGEQKELVIEAQYDKELERYIIGFEREEVYIYFHPNPFSAVYNDITTIYRVLGALISRKISFGGLGGPVAIVRIMGVSAQISFVYFLSILALVCVNLGVVNLLPIPVLDGGHIIFSLAELVRKKPLHEKTMIIIQNTFVALLVTLILFITVNDVRKWIGKRSVPQEQVEAVEGQAGN
ncbi:RIP metalloprotease RseP [Chlamydiota bacterium]